LLFHAKCESGAPLEFCSLEHIPAITRWCRKYAGVVEHAAGALCNWKFLGFNGGLAQEAAGLYAMGEGRDLPRRLAIRDFGLANARQVLRAWREFDRAMSFHPFSNQSAGYFKGPFFIGPAQPLFFEEPREVPDCFLNPTGHRPIWMTNLRFAMPFGVPAMLRALDRMLTHWEKGCAFLEGIGGRHAALASLFLTFLRTASNMTRFFALRDSLWERPLSVERHHQVIAELATIAKQELANAKEARRLLTEYPDLSFSVTYRHGVCLENLDWKIAHTEHLLAKELPMQDYGFAFSRNRTPVWTEC
ncbi:MAG: hypothetical protein IJJ33_16005, partial [Victivallales bacterium]|nr:hypothetical protein [Victivallales bacterium]